MPQKGNAMGSWRMLSYVVAGVALTGSAIGAESRHWYASAGVGWNQADNVRFDDAAGSVGFDLAAPTASLALGFAVNHDWRLELEASRRSNDVEILRFPNSGVEVDPDPNDDLSATGVSLNLLRDFVVGTAWRPYLGVGAGIADVSLSVTDTGVQAQIAPGQELIDDSTTAFAFQLIAGFTVPLTRRLQLAADYRYWGMPSVELEDRGGEALDFDYTAHSAWVHLRYHHATSPYPPFPDRSRVPGVSKFYVSAFAGAGFAPDSDIAGNSTNFDAYDVGPIVALVAGYRMRERWRLELEAAYRSNDAEIIDYSPAIGEDSASGRVKARSLMANVVFQPRPNAWIRPFIGFGSGWTTADFDVRTNGATFVDDSDSDFAFQSMLGVDVAVTSRLTFTTEYRFWITSWLNLDQPDGTRLKTDHRVHSMMVGLRYTPGATR